MMRTKLAAGAALAICIALLPGIPATHASFSGDNGKIVFDLFCVDDTECDPSDNGIYEAIDGDIARLTSDPGDMSPAWSSDGQRLAFSRCDETDCDIWTADADGSNETALTDSNELNEWEPAWAPGENTLVYRSCPVDQDPNACDLLIDDPVNGQTELTDNARVEQDPAWSPNGRWIVFEAGKCSSEAVGQAHCTYKNPPQIYKLAVDGDKAVKITSMDKGARDPNYSPGGKRIVFNDDTGRLFTISPKGTGLRKFGRAGADGINDGDYSPDALFFIMTVYIGDEAGIYTWNLENDETEELFSHPYLWPDSPAWQPVP